MFGAMTYLHYVFERMSSGIVPFPMLCVGVVSKKRHTNSTRAYCLGRFLKSGGVFLRGEMCEAILGEKHQHKTTWIFASKSVLVKWVFLAGDEARL